MNGKAIFVKKLQKNGADVNLVAQGKGIPAYTPLQLAIYSGALQTAQMLLQLGADPNLGTSREETPLHLVAEAGYVEMARVLLSKGAKVDATDHYADTPLCRALQHDQEGVVQLLSSYGSHAGNALWWAADQGNLSEVQRLLDLEVPTDQAPLRQESTPLSRASQNGHTEVTLLLIERGAEVKTNSIPLHEAAKKGDMDLAKSLIEHGARVNATRGRARTSPLYEASCQGNLAVVNLLLKHQANPNQGPDFYKPLYGATQNKHENIAHRLIDAGANVNGTARFNPLQIAAKHNLTALAIRLIECNADVNGIDSQCRTPLHEAAQWGNVELARALLNCKDIIVYAKLMYSGRSTPLYLAAQCGHATVAELLIQRGADLNFKNELDHCTALQVAQEKLSAAQNRGKQEAVARCQETVKILKRGVKEAEERG